VISFVNVKKSFGEKRILKGVTFDVREGEVFFIIGSSGVGKSVLIKQLVGLLKPDEGQIFLDGEDVTRLDERQMYAVRKKCAMVFQHSTLFDSMTCAENVALPLRKHRALDRADSLSEAIRLLGNVQMERYAASYPAELGDGMRKRVAIARALTMNPRCVLFDEPTTSLDPVSARRIDRLIRTLGDDMGVTCIVVSHDLRSIFGVADRVAMLYHGVVRLLGTPEELRSSSDGVVQQFINGRAQGPMD
jgi:phospholipid/cholesterol/gamma-HCH transport system ATP-binding protein